jgi:sugar phosphate isomerase/epimerase
MTVQLGTVAAVGFEDFSPAEWLATFRDLGCRVVQAYRNQEGNISTRDMAEAIASGGMPCDSLHGVYGEQYDPSAPDESDRKRAVETFKAEGEIALELGGPLVVVHCSTVRPDGVAPRERSCRMDQLKRSIEELGRFGASRGVRYAFENLPGYHAIGHDVAELAAAIRDVDAPATGICLDTGHANMVGDAAEAVRIASDRIIYVHFSDNSGASDDHDMPTYGTLDCGSVARALHEVGYDGTLMLEVFYAAERMRELLAAGCRERLAEIVAVANGRGG